MQDAEIPQKLGPGAEPVLVQLLFPASFRASAAVVCRIRDRKNMSAVLSALKKLGPLTDLLPHVARVDKATGEVRVAVCMQENLEALNSLLQEKYQSQLSRVGAQSIDEMVKS